MVNCIQTDIHLRVEFILANDRSYILTGTIPNGNTSIHSCGFHKLTSDVSDNVKRGFEGEYQPQCN